MSRVSRFSEKRYKRTVNPLLIPREETGDKNKPISPEQIESASIHWKLALDYLSQVDLDSLPAEHALRQLVRTDVPLLLQNLSR